MTPGVYKPQLAMLTREPPDGEQWLQPADYDGQTDAAGRIAGTVLSVWLARFVRALLYRLEPGDALNVVSAARSHNCEEAGAATVT
jgi:hypothetical protein